MSAFAATRQRDVAERAFALADPCALRQELEQLRRQVSDEGRHIFAGWRPLIHRRTFLPSALNLAHYLALRRRDLRALQAALVPWGLSSLGRSESHVLASLDAVIATLTAVCGEDAAHGHRPPLRAFSRGERLLQQNTEQLFGRRTGPRSIAIMVTLPTEAADDLELVRALLTAGMDCARINCAHDDRSVWARMIANVRRVAAETGHVCTVAMDLAGPKVRTAKALTPDPHYRLHRDDRILLTRGTPAEPGLLPCQAACSIPEILDQLTVGAEVWIDDGKFGARVEALRPEGAVLVVTQTGPKGARLRSDKGLNFPDIDLRISPLTERDLIDLDFVTRHADLIGYSFVQDAADVELLQRELRRRLPEPAPLPPLIAKIETRRAVRNLPALIVQAAGRQPFGVMIARGDLAVEIGYQRLAEMQEEILWLCEAAHVPVIWATQVLERLVKKGIPSRAEMTDAAMAERAECVMLNKGPFVVEAVTMLDDVLVRMQAHQLKKTPRLRALRQWAISESDRRE